MATKDEMLILEQQTDQRVFDILQRYLPEEWQEVVLFAGYYNDNSGYFKYWIKQEDGSYIDCFKLIPAPQDEQEDKLKVQLKKIHTALASVRAKIKENQKWVCYEMHVTDTGKLTKNYDYAEGVNKKDYKEYILKYKNNLNKKYL